MDLPYEQLVSALLVLFKSDELRRFIRGTFGTRIAALSRGKESEQEQIRAMVEELVDHNLVDDTLFDALLERKPEQAELIERVRAELHTDRSAPRGLSRPAGVPPEGPISEERQAWRESLKTAFDKLAASKPVLPEDLIFAAAVHPNFDPTKLKPFRRDGSKQPEGTIMQLAELCNPRADGRWELAPKERRQALATLWQEGALIGALDANPHERSTHEKLLRRLWESHPIPFRELDRHEELLAALDIADWMVGIEEDLFNVDRVHAALERYQRIAPLRKLVGTHFRGRNEELEKLRSHASPTSETSPIMTVWGLGGTGKSALLGKFLLDFDEETEPSRPWAYLDFDDPTISTSNPSKLIELIARQLSLLYAGLRDSESGRVPEQDLIGVESLAGGDLPPGGAFALVATGAESPGELVGGAPPLNELIKRLGDAIRRLPMKPSLLLVLDTFEQVQVRGQYATQLARTLLDAIIGEMPFSRIIVSGRADICEWDDRCPLPLGELDPQSADAVLEALGVDQADARKAVIERLGTNPLTMRFVAEGWKTGRLSATDIEGMLVGARSLELQGHLYTRILGHIQDGEIRRLAHPGLVVRRVTRGVIADVLAEICEINADRVDALFDRLPNHVSLFEPDRSAPGEGEALRHRQDVREVMLKLMIDDPRWCDRLDEIHSKAILHYADIDHPIARAEELYHRLMRDDAPEDLDRLWSDDLAASLGRSWEAPFPERARLWLGPRLGRLEAKDDSWRIADRELTTRREAEAHLSSGNPQGALDLLRASPDRAPGSRLYAMEASALRKLGRLDEAYEVCERGLKALSETSVPRVSMRLEQIAAEISFDRGDFEAATTHADAALRFASALEDTNAQLSTLALSVRAQRARSDPAATKNEQQLEHLFVTADEHELRNAPKISEEIVDTLGEKSRGVLRKAAVTFGNWEKQSVISQDAFALEKLLLKAQETDLGRSELSRLATQVGLPSRDFKMLDLAGATIRYGRMGDALGLVLNHAGDDAAVRLDTLSMFKKGL